MESSGRAPTLARQVRAATIERQCGRGPVYAPTDVLTRLPAAPASGLRRACALLCATLIGCAADAHRGAHTGQQGSSHLNIGVVDAPSVDHALGRAVAEPFSRRSRIGVDVWEVAPDSLDNHTDSAGRRQPAWDILVVPSAIFTSRVRRSGFACVVGCQGGGSRAERPDPRSHEGIPLGYAGRVILYRDADVGAHPPRAWSDFWDTGHVPGPRALPDDPRGVLELALLADGVPPTQLYPLDVNRAFRHLAQLRPHVSMWWSRESELATAIRAGTVAMAVVPSTFANVHEFPIGDGDFSVVDAVTALDARWLVIPASTPVTADDRRFLNFATDTASRHALAESGVIPIADIPTVRAARSLGATTNLATTPTGPFVINDAWWAVHGAEVARKWQAWRASPPAPATVTPRVTALTSLGHAR